MMRSCPHCKQKTIPVDQVGQGCFCRKCGKYIEVDIFYSGILSLSLCLATLLSAKIGVFILSFLLLALSAIRLVFLEYIDTRFLPIKVAKSKGREM